MLLRVHSLFATPALSQVFLCGARAGRASRQLWPSHKCHHRTSRHSHCQVSSVGAVAAIRNRHRLTQSAALGPPGNTGSGRAARVPPRHPDCCRQPVTPPPSSPPTHAPPRAKTRRVAGLMADRGSFFTAGRDAMRSTVEQVGHRNLTGRPLSPCSKAVPVLHSNSAFSCCEAAAFSI